MNLSDAEKNRALCDALLDEYDADYVISGWWSRVIQTDSEAEMSAILNNLSESVEFTTEYLFSGDCIAYEVTLPRVIMQEEIVSNGDSQLYGQ